MTKQDRADRRARGGDRGEHGGPARRPGALRRLRAGDDRRARRASGHRRGPQGGAPGTPRARPAGERAARDRGAAARDHATNCSTPARSPVESLRRDPPRHRRPRAHTRSVGADVLLASRPLIEGHVRRRVLALPNVTVRERCDAIESAGRPQTGSRDRRARAAPRRRPLRRAARRRPRRRRERARGARPRAGSRRSATRVRRRSGSRSTCCT